MGRNVLPCSSGATGVCAIRNGLAPVRGGPAGPEASSAGTGAGPLAVSLVSATRQGRIGAAAGATSEASRRTPGPSAGRLAMSAARTRISSASPAGVLVVEAAAGPVACGVGLATPCHVEESPGRNRAGSPPAGGEQGPNAGVRRSAAPPAGEGPNPLAATRRLSGRRGCAGCSGSRTGDPDRRTKSAKSSGAVPVSSRAAGNTVRASNNTEVTAAGALPSCPR